MFPSAGHDVLVTVVGSRRPRYAHLHLLVVFHMHNVLALFDKNSAMALRDVRLAK